MLRTRHKTSYTIRMCNFRSVKIAIFIHENDVLLFSGLLLFVFVYSFRVYMCEHSTDNQSISIYCIYIICCWFVMCLLVLQDCVYFQSLPHFLCNEIDYLCNGIIVGGIIVSSSLLFLFFFALISLSICWTNKNEIELKNGNWIG